MGRGNPFLFRCAERPPHGSVCDPGPTSELRDTTDEKRRAPYVVEKVL
jgi:hypothetical protein